MQLRLVDAAHILPVAVEGFTDDTMNGIVLSPTMHRAFDHALIYLEDDHVIRLNDDKAAKLRTLKLSDSLSKLQDWMGQQIHLPADSGLRPDPGFIRAANEHRQIPGY
jgi:putative restriction endonuclease